MLHATSCVASAPASLCNGHSRTLNTPTRHRQGWAAPVAACAAQKGQVPFRFGSQQIRVPVCSCGLGSCNGDVTSQPFLLREQLWLW